jgi:hypothetical protein
MNHRQSISLNQHDSVNGRRVLICLDSYRFRERKAYKGRPPTSFKRQAYSSDWHEPTQIVIKCFNIDNTICDDILPIYDATMSEVNHGIELIEGYLFQLNITTTTHVTFCADDTLNKSFGDWQELFGEQVIATAIFDRLLHYCRVFNIKGYCTRFR